MKLKEMLLQIERLYDEVNKGIISEDMYYMLEEEINNVIINTYSIEEIEKAQKELGINYDN